MSFEMFGRGRGNVIEPDDEIAVYDWGETAIPRLTGYQRLEEPPPARTARSAISLNGCFGSVEQVSYNSRMRPNSNLEDSFNMPVPLSSNWYYSNPPDSSYLNLNAPGPLSYPYFDERQNMVPISTGINISSSTYYQKGAEWEYNPPHRANLGLNRTAPAPQSVYWNCKANVEEKISDDKDDDWSDIEEIDYSKNSSHFANANDVNIPEAVVTSSTSNSPSTLNTTSRSINLPEVPKSSLPLNEVFSGVPKEKNLLAGIRNSRKRKRTGVEQEESSDLVNLLGKTKHRFSARNYAKPSRKVDSMPSTNDRSCANEKQSVISCNSTINDIVREDHSHQSNENHNNFEELKSATDTDNNYTSAEEEFEAQLRIRTDIFEEEDD